MTATSTDLEAVLWQVRLSIFSEKGRWALDYKGIPYRRRDFKSGMHPILLKLRGRGTTVPVLDVKGRDPIPDTTAIIAALEELQPDPPLYPEDDAERREALELEDFFDEHCGHDIRKIVLDEMFNDRRLMFQTLLRDAPRPARWASPVMFPLVARPLARRYYGINAESAKLAQTKVAAAVDRLESQLGDGDYMVGDRFSVADLTAAALLAHVLLPAEYPYPMWDPDDSPQGFREVRDRLLARRGGQWALEMYRRHRRPYAPDHAGV